MALLRHHGECDELPADLSVGHILRRRRRIDAVPLRRSGYPDPDADPDADPDDDHHDLDADDHDGHDLDRDDLDRDDVDSDHHDRDDVDSDDLD